MQQRHHHQQQQQQGSSSLPYSSSSLHHSSQQHSLMSSSPSAQQQVDMTSLSTSAATPADDVFLDDDEYVSPRDEESYPLNISSSSTTAHDENATAAGAQSSSSSFCTRLQHWLTPPGLHSAIREHDLQSSSSFPSYLPRTRRAFILLFLSLLSILLLLDVFVLRQPYGLIALHELRGVGRSQYPPASSTPCGWDYEASWKIGTLKGSSPLMLDVASKQQPTISCESISHIPASFVADPFLFVPGNSFTSSTSNKAYTLSSGSHCDMTRAQPTFTAAADAKHHSQACYNTALTNRNNEIYMFYEIKNLQTRAGELGASVSVDRGMSWKSVGTILRETFPDDPKKVLHLSYPHVFTALEPSTGEIELLMVPETNKLGEVRIYRTDSCCFPFGWKHVATKLKGQPFVDTSIVWSGDRWYIFTSVEYTLHLYMTSGENKASLVNSDWVEHPSSPLYQHDKRFGRNGGRIIPYDSGFIRFAQDCSGVYGEKLHVMRVTTLNEREYSEEWSHMMKPSTLAHMSNGGIGLAGMGGSSSAGVVQADYLTHRLHHVDLVWLPEDASSSLDSTPSSPAYPLTTSTSHGRWFGVTDGDNIPDDYHFWKQEGWFWSLKFCLFLVVFIVTVYQLWKQCVLHLYVLRPANKMYGWMRKRLLILRSNIELRFRRAGIRSNAAFLRKVYPLIVVPIAAFILAYLLTNLYPFDPTGTPHSGDAHARSGAVQSYSELALSSQAYTHAHVWKQQAEWQLGLKSVSTHDADRLLDKIESTGVVQTGESKLTSVLEVAVSEHRCVAKDATGNPFLPRPFTCSNDRATTDAAVTSSVIAIGNEKKTYFLIGTDELAFEQTLNLIASIQFWWSTPASRHNIPGSSTTTSTPSPEPLTSSPTILIYDLGLTPAQRTEVSCLRHVILRRLDYSNLPTHVRVASSGAWLPHAFQAVMDDTELNITPGDRIIHLAYNVEWRGAPTKMLASLQTKGHFMSRKYHTHMNVPLSSHESRASYTKDRDLLAREHGLAERTSPVMLHALEVEPRLVQERPLCDTSVLGFVVSKYADSPQALVLPAALECAGKLECMHPGSITQHSAFSHSHLDNLFSALFVKNGFSCEKPGMMSVSEEEQIYPEDVTLFAATSESLDLPIARSSGRYRKHLLSDQSSDGTCTRHDWSTPSEVRDADWSLPLSHRADISSQEADIWSCWHDGKVVAAIRASCLKEMEAYRSSLITPPLHNTSPSFTHRLRQKTHAIWFWIFFFLTCTLVFFSTFRRSLYATKKRACLLGVVLLLVCLIPVYRMALNRWGTFAPWNALMYTAKYHYSNEWREDLSPLHVDQQLDSSRTLLPAFAISREALSLHTDHPIGKNPRPLGETPSPNWRPHNRIVVSFTTMPHHVDKLSETIDSLLAQTMVPDAIYLNLPNGRNKRTNQSYEILPYLIEKYGANKTSIFKITRCTDVGPLTKLVPTLEVENDPNTFVITVDSDKTYHPLAIATLVWHSYHDSHTAFGLCGWSFFWQPEPMEVVPVYVPWLVRGEGRVVDVLQAVCGNVYRRAFFPDLSLLRQPHPKCFTTDDLWIAGYLATRSHIKRVIINTPGAYSTAWGSIEPISVSWKANDPEQWQLSSHNTKPGVDMACIRGVEERLGPWRATRARELSGADEQEGNARTGE